jgi:hypothetical protein
MPNNGKKENPAAGKPDAGHCVTNFASTSVVKAGALSGL